MMTRSSQTTLESADPLGEEATLLLHAMRAEALSRYRDVVEALGAPPTNEPLGPRCAVLIARLQGRVVGCAALRLMEEEVAEITPVIIPTCRVSA